MFKLPTSFPSFLQASISPPKDINDISDMRWIGLTLIFLGAVLNRWFLSWLTGRDPTVIEETTANNIWTVEIICILVGIGFFFSEKTSRIIAQIGAWLPIVWILQKPSPRIFLASTVIGLADVPSWYLVIIQAGHSPWHPLFLVGIGVKSLCLALLMVAILRCGRLRFGRLIPCLFVTVVCGSLLATEALMITNGGTRFEWRMLDLMDCQAVASMLDGHAYFIIVWVTAWTGLASLVLAGEPSATSRSSVRPLLLFVLLTLLLPLDRLASQVWMLSVNALRRAENQSIVHTAGYLAEVPLVRFVRLFLTQESTHRLTPESARPPLLAAYDVGFMHPPEVVPWPAGRYRRIIFITCESLSLPLIGSANSTMPGSPTPFFDSLSGGHPLFRTTCQPTTPGLIVHFTSQPNYRLEEQMGFPHSVVPRLRDAGWLTCQLSSASRFFDQSAQNAAALGFAEMRGSELSATQGYPIAGWGVTDRSTFSEAVSWLESNREKKTFLHILTIDTHPPHGRSEYNGQEYPNEPDWIAGMGAASELLRSVFRLDHDIGNFISRLKQQGLLDHETVVVLTADHCFPIYPSYLAVPGTNPTPYERIPFMVFNGDGPVSIRTDLPSSQLATAPSLADLAGVAHDPYWWGRSIFTKKVGLKPVFVGQFQDAYDFLDPHTLQPLPAPIAEQLEILVHGIMPETRSSPVPQGNTAP